ncbi:hypothetical protein M153_2930006326 [Pseudoloma neurophilia]|uniref:Uncharacterized protein n=1 Tax=Pseudoloma neurophilia TaxID=146866 RepID=A0A0R0M496_9MICR|nr:hypothetical protein M153_2930006326 [Pseudoloma neurophilia]
MSDKQHKNEPNNQHVKKLSNVENPEVDKKSEIKETEKKDKHTDCNAEQTENAVKKEKASEQTPLITENTTTFTKTDSEPTAEQSEKNIDQTVEENKQKDDLPFLIDKPGITFSSSSDLLLLLENNPLLLQTVDQNEKNHKSLAEKLPFSEQDLEHNQKNENLLIENEKSQEVNEQKSALTLFQTHLKRSDLYNCCLLLKSIFQNEKLENYRQTVLDIIEKVKSDKFSENSEISDDDKKHFLSNNLESLSDEFFTKVNINNYTMFRHLPYEEILDEKIIDREIETAREWLTSTKNEIGNQSLNLHKNSLLMQNEKNDETNDQFLSPLLPFFLLLIPLDHSRYTRYLLYIGFKTGNVKFTYKMLIKKFMENYSVLDRLFIESNKENHSKDKEVCINEKNTTHKQEFTLQENLLSDLQALTHSKHNRLDLILELLLIYMKEKKITGTVSENNIMIDKPLFSDEESNNISDKTNNSSKEDNSLNITEVIRLSTCLLVIYHKKNQKFFLKNAFSYLEYIGNNSIYRLVLECYQPTTNFLQPLTDKKRPLSELLPNIGKIIKEYNQVEILNIIKNNKTFLSKEEIDMAIAKVIVTDDSVLNLINSVFNDRPTVQSYFVIFLELVKRCFTNIISEEVLKSTEPDIQEQQNHSTGKKSVIISENIEKQTFVDSELTVSSDTNQTKSDSTADSGTPIDSPNESNNEPMKSETVQLRSEIGALKSENESTKSGNESIKSETQSLTSGSESPKSETQSLTSGSESLKSGNGSPKSETQSLTSGSESESDKIPSLEQFIPLVVSLYEQGNETERLFITENIHTLMYKQRELQERISNETVLLLRNTIDHLLFLIQLDTIGIKNGLLSNIYIKPYILEYLNNNVKLEKFIRNLNNNIELDWRFRLKLGQFLYEMVGGPQSNGEISELVDEKTEKPKNESKEENSLNSLKPFHQKNLFTYDVNTIWKKLAYEKDPVWYVRKWWLSINN